MLFVGAIIFIALLFMPFVAAGRMLDPEAEETLSEWLVWLCLPAGAMIAWWAYGAGQGRQAAVALAIGAGLMAFGRMQGLRRRDQGIMGAAVLAGGALTSLASDPPPVLLSLLIGACACGYPFVLRQLSGFMIVEVEADETLQDVDDDQDEDRGEYVIMPADSPQPPAPASTEPLRRPDLAQSIRAAEKSRPAPGGSTGLISEIQAASKRREPGDTRSAHAEGPAAVAHRPGSWREASLPRQPGGQAPAGSQPSRRADLLTGGAPARLPAMLDLPRRPQSASFERRSRRA